MPLTVPGHLAGVEAPCPGCGRIIQAPTAESIAAEQAVGRHAPSAAGFLRDPRDSNQWSESLSAHRLPDDDKIVLPPEVQAMLQRRAQAAGMPAAVTGPETVEDLLRGVQFTVKDTNTTRNALLHMALFVAIAVPLGIYGPPLVKHLQTKPAAPASTPPAVVQASAKPQPKPALESASSVTSSTGWKPGARREQQPKSVVVRKGGPRVVSVDSGSVASNNALVRTNANGGPRAVSFRSAPTGSRYNTSFTSSQANSSRESVEIVEPSSFSQPVVAATDGGDPSDKFYNASLPMITERTDSTPDWMLVPTDQWPVIQLHNEGSFRGHSPAEGTNCVLVEHDDGALWVATASCLLGAAGGVDPPVEAEDFRRKLVRWCAVIPQDGNRLLEVKNGAELVTATGAGCLLIKAPNGSTRALAKAMKLSAEDAREGEMFYICVLTPSDPQSQFVYTAKSVGTRSALELVVSPKIDCTGFAGAAVLNQSGDLAGIVVASTSSGRCIATPAAVIKGLISKQ